MKHLLLVTSIILIFQTCYGQNTNWGEKFSDAIISRYQPTINTMTNKDWDHSNSIILHGMEKIYDHTKSPQYLNYIKSFVDEYVAEDGKISGLKSELDGMHPGVLCLFLYQVTRDEKYKLAAKEMKDFLIGTSSKPSVFNKTPDGGYWHKNNDHYENVMTIDGAYMANPFLVKYGNMFNDKTCFDIATRQTLLVASRTFNLETKLPYHGWDFAMQHSWSNPITGTSSEVWSRSIGWFAMALVDILEYLPENHPDYPTIKYLFQQLATGIKSTQNSTNGLWYQMVSHPDAKDNYPESSGYGMIIYALQKGVDHHWIDESFSIVAQNGWNGMKNFINTYEDDLPQITSFNPGMGIKNNLEEYLAVRPVNCPSNAKKQHPHGYCAILMAASEMEY